MSKKDFRLLADIIATELSLLHKTRVYSSDDQIAKVAQVTAVENLAISLADYLAMIYPRFKKGVFLQACTVTRRDK
jgi:hypothetical protein